MSDAHRAPGAGAGAGAGAGPGPTASGPTAPSPTAPVRLRVLGEADWPLWREARLTALAEAPHAFKARLQDWPHGGEDRWRERLAMPDAHNVVALVDGRLAGMAAGMPGSGGVRELRSLWVDPRARGRGVGDRLIASVEDWARASGAATLRLAVLPDNDAAAALYRRHGFAVTDEVGDLLPDGVTRERVMVKELGPGAGERRP
ncbi:GNAT family N-acetyltransferase [Streptomyces triticagri]|uniref:GNAT family N-acetyltransferase n=1 Tax=Streptomyces triticagri TaxID=2293568 RepID=A0A372M4W4_9ACTN|nr:GNAT family N-acetyltransferase [Streptomyces triticagri]RFU85978.1 GNAT family N-acetyltransferase [Streptomyces triticagri]